MEKERPEKEYFASWFRLNNIDYYLIWISSDPDLVITDAQGKIPVFRSEFALARYAKANNLEIVNEEPILHNLDAVAEWLQQPEAEIDCHELLAAWNFFMDALHALNQEFLGNKQTRLRNRIYDKLFYGNNIYNLTPNGEYYIPQWRPAERKKIAQILTQGLEVFRKHISETKET